jgi:hypothetical protein
MGKAVTIEGPLHEGINSITIIAQLTRLKTVGMESCWWCCNDFFHRILSCLLNPPPATTSDHECSCSARYHPPLLVLPLPAGDPILLHDTMARCPSTAHIATPHITSFPPYLDTQVYQSTGPRETLVANQEAVPSPPAFFS